MAEPIGARCPNCNLEGDEMEDQPSWVDMLHIAYRCLTQVCPVDIYIGHHLTVVDRSPISLVIVSEEAV